MEFDFQNNILFFIFKAFDYHYKIYSFFFFYAISLICQHDFQKLVSNQNFSYFKRWYTILFLRVLLKSHKHIAEWRYLCTAAQYEYNKCDRNVFFFFKHNNMDLQRNITFP